MNTETLYTMLKSALFAGRSSVLNAARQDCFNLYKMASSRQDQEMLIKLDALFRPELQRFIDSKNIDAFYDMESSGWQFFCHPAAFADPLRYGQRLR